MRKFLLAALTAAFVVASTGTAGAWYAKGGTYSSGEGTVQVYGEPGENNNLTAEGRHLSVVALGMKGVRLHDPDNPVTRTDADRPGCTLVDAHTLDCNSVHYIDGGEGSVHFLETWFGDGDDRLYVPSTSSSLQKVVMAGPGNDAIVGKDRGGAYASLDEGNDSITLRGGGSAGWHPFEDIVHGGAGDDVLRLVNLADDNPYCGDGTDVLYADTSEINADDGCETVHAFP